VRRREFFALTGGLAAWPLSLRAQQPASPVLGFLGTGSPEPFAHLVTSFHRGLKEAGFVEGQNVRVEYRWAEAQFERLPSLAAHLVAQKVDVILARRAARASHSAFAFAQIRSRPILPARLHLCVGQSVTRSFACSSARCDGGSRLASNRRGRLRSLEPAQERAGTHQVAVLGGAVLDLTCEGQLSGVAGPLSHPTLALMNVCRQGKRLSC
jgi:hypothetical protein